MAVKVLKPGMDTRQVIARFEAERQALALMDHPNIARVLDAGETGSGRPHFVMELVRGVAITDYCDQNRLTTRARLELFVHVCQAVQHAHHKGIIHRDIEPSNVMVTLHDEAPVVKVIDFGIAKALGQQLTDKTLVTGFAQMIGTPLYMSPEQAGMSGLDIDTRSDIYSLGVLLYELLTGITPFDKERLRAAGYDEMRRVIREEEPARPSTRLSTLGQAAATLSTQRQSDPKRLSQLLRGELDWIVMKTLEKDRNRRYETANELARDVERYLHDEPVLACPPSAWYRFRKFARRKKAALAMAACVFLALAGIAGAVGWAVRDRLVREDEIAKKEAEQRKDIERKEARQRDEIDREVTRALDEAAELGNKAKWPEALSAVERARKLLDAAGRQDFPQRLGDLEADVAMVLRLEEIYRNPKRELKSDLVVAMGSDGPYWVPQRAELSSEGEFFSDPQQDAEFAAAFREFGIDTDSLELAEAAARITGRSIRRELAKGLDGWAALRRRRFNSLPSWKKLVAIACQADPDVWRNRCREALLRGDRQGLEQLADSVPIRQLPPATLWLLGSDLMELGARDKAVALLRKAQYEYPDDASINFTLGWFCWTKFQPPLYDDALRFYSATLALWPRRGIQLHMAQILMEKGAVEEAMAEFSKAIELNPHAWALWAHRGNAYKGLKQFDKALADHSKAIELGPKYAVVWNNRGETYVELRQWDKALADYSKAIEVDPKYAPSWSNRGRVYGDMKQWDKAIADYQRAAELRPEDPYHWYYLALAHLTAGDRDGYRRVCADILKRFGKTKDPYVADRVLAACLPRPDALADMATLLPLAELAPTKNARALGAALYRAGKYESAIEPLNQGMSRAWDHLFLAMAHHHLGHTDKAREYLERAGRQLNPNAYVWPEKVEAAQLYREAEALLLGIDAYQVDIADYQKALEKNPNDAGAHNDLAWSLATCPEAKFRDPKRAVELAKKAVKLEPKNGFYWQTLAYAEYRAGDWESAIAALEEVKALGSPGDSMEWYPLAMAHWQLGHKEEARKWYDLAVAWMEKNQPKNEELCRFRAEAAELLGVEEKKD